jgi:hypothetical protein
MRKRSFLQRVADTLLYMIKFIIFIILLIPTIIIGINFYDPPPDKEIVKLKMENPVPPESENGFLYQMKMGADNVKNETILEEYKILTRYPRYVETGIYPFTAEKPRYNIIELQEFVSADILLKSAQGHAEEALQDWLSTQRFHTIVKSDQNSSVQKNLSIIAQKKHFLALVKLLRKHPDLAKKHQAEILESLSGPSSESDGINVDLLFLAELHTLSAVRAMVAAEENYFIKIKLHLFYSENDTANTLYAFYKDIKKAMEFPPSDEYVSLQEKHNPIDLSSVYGALSLLYNPIGKFLVGPMMSAEGLIFRNRWYVIADARLLGVYVQALAKDVPLQNMPAFLADLPSIWNNPYTDAPFMWDADTQEIYYQTREFPAAVRHAISFKEGHSARR